MKKTILVTGGTGSFGNAMLRRLLADESVGKIIIFSRDELKQHEMQLSLSKEDLSKIRFFLGDVRDSERLDMAFEGVDFIIHAAALKQVPAAEYNPFEFIKTNVLGAQNIINAALKRNIKKVIALSTDKAASPINLYGATKLCSDKLFVAANNISGIKDTKFSVVRYGNVMKSRGSVIPFFLNLKSQNTSLPPVTDPRMTRFNISLDEGVEMVNWCIDNAKGGEIFVPKIPSYNIIDLVEAIFSSREHQVIGIRPGEKLHEEMISISDSRTTYDLGKYYAILPADNESLVSQWVNHGAELVPENFSCNSLENHTYLNVEELRMLINDEK